MMLDENILVNLDSEVYKYNYQKNSFEIRNYFKTNFNKLLEENQKIIEELSRNNIKFKLEKDNTIFVMN